MRETNGHDEWKTAMAKAQELLDQGNGKWRKRLSSPKKKARRLGAARQKGREAWDEVRASGLNSLDDVRDKSEEMWKMSRSCEENPARAIGLNTPGGCGDRRLNFSRPRD